jgi:hypothetical protein
MGEPVLLQELRAGSLEAAKRRADLRRWARAWTGSREEPLEYTKGIREGLACSVAFVESGRFGPAQLCVHRLAGACESCDELATREGGDERAILELELALRSERYAELERWRRTYAAGDGDAAQGTAKGLDLALEYLESGSFAAATAPPAPPARAANGRASR